jgi:glycosyltransferase involved in cell wall biosynthesis
MNKSNDDKKTVVHILNTGQYSGAENVVITLINSMKNEVDNVYVSPDGSIRKILEQNGIPYYAVDKVSVANIKKVIKDIQPMIIHAHDFKAGMVCAVAAGKTPVINHLHNNSPWIKRLSLKSFLYGITCFRYQKILTVSDAVMNEFIFGKWLKKKTIVVGNPVNISIIQKKAEEPFYVHNAGIHISDIIFIGRLTPQKNIFLLLEILKKVKEKKTDLNVSIVGDGELRTEFEEKIYEYNMHNYITLYGFQENPYPFLKAARVMCMPSKWEGFGLAAVEGLALGKPVVAAPVGGLADIVDSTCGRLCQSKDEYVNELYHLLTDPEYYTEKSKGARKRAESFDNVDRYKKRIMNIYFDSLRGYRE